MPDIEPKLTKVPDPHETPIEAPQRRRPGALAADESKSKTLLIAGLAFAATILVLFLVYKFVL